LTEYANQSTSINLSYGLRETLKRPVSIRQPLKPHAPFTSFRLPLKELATAGTYLIHLYTVTHCITQALHHGVRMQWYAGSNYYLTPFPYQRFCA
jgi:hypothetical protein